MNRKYLKTKILREVLKIDFSVLNSLDGKNLARFNGQGRFFE